MIPILGPKSFSITAGAIFLIITLLHALRIFYGWEAAIGGLIVPKWASWIALVISAYLAYAGLSLAWWLFKIDSRVEAVAAALPRDRPEAAALEDADAWQYPEMDGPVWRYNNICLLPIPERERLKSEKPAVWAAYWEETLRRPQYVLADGRRLAKSDIFAMNTMNRLLLSRVDPDVMDWYMHGREF